MGRAKQFQQLDNVEYLIKKYLHEERTLDEIAQEIGCVGESVRQSLQNHKIERLPNKNQIYNDNWENVVPKLPNKVFDLIYIDPPYGMNYISNIPGAKNWNKKRETDSKFDRPLRNDTKNISENINWAKLASQSFRTLKNNSYMFIHCNINLLMQIGNIFITDRLFQYKGCIVWDKRSAIGGDIKGRMKNDWEPILYLAKGKPKFNPVKVVRKGKIEERKRISEIMDWKFSEIDNWDFSVMGQKKTGFPTQKPIELAKQVINLTTNKGDLVADFFAGSNTALRAAKELERNYFGTEIDSIYYNKFKI